MKSDGKCDGKSSLAPAVLPVAELGRGVKNLNTMWHTHDAAWQTSNKTYLYRRRALARCSGVSTISSDS